MSQHLHTLPPGARDPRPGRAVRPWLRMTSVLLLLGSLGSMALFSRKGPKTPIQAEAEVGAGVLPGSMESPGRSDSPLVGSDAVSASPPALAPAGPTVPSVPPLVLPEPSPQTRQWVYSLSRPGQVGQPITSEQAAEWKQTLQQLVQEGANAVPAILEFLQQNKDVDFDSAASRALGYASARQALFDALTQINGPEAISAMLQTLQNTADPREIALLAQDLEKLEPEQHRQEELEAARQVLATASARKFEATDVAPLFEVLQRYGGAPLATELEQATRQWSYYGTIALAQLPDGAGIPALVSMAQDPKTANGTREAVFQMLAQVSPQFPEAWTALLERARSNAISDYAWRLLGPVLAGDQVGLLNSAFEDRQGLSQASGLRTTHTSDNQSYFSLPSNLTPEQVNQRGSLIDQLLAATSDPTAKEVLQQSKDRLARQQPHTVAIAP